MIRTLATLVAALSLLAFAHPAPAVEIVFTADLKSANEVSAIPVVAAAEGNATLTYDTKNTATLVDDTYDFVLTVISLTDRAVAYHIHAPATTLQNAAVRVSLDAAPFVTLISTAALLQVSGNDIAVPALIPAQNGFPAMSFLDVLNMGLAYVNVHTPLHPGGETRGQLLAAVGPIPEPETYALMALGLGALGLVARRRRARGLTSP